MNRQISFSGTAYSFYFSFTFMRKAHLRCAVE